MQLPPKPALRLQGLTLWFSSFITKQQHETVQESGSEAAGKRPEIDLEGVWQTKCRRKMSSEITTWCSTVTVCFIYVEVQLLLLDFDGRQRRR